LTQSFGILIFGASLSLAELGGISTSSMAENDKFNARQRQAQYFPLFRVLTKQFYTIFFRIAYLPNKCIALLFCHECTDCHEVGLPYLGFFLSFLFFLRFVNQWVRWGCATLATFMGCWPG
jgi:hypothetical protein